jgi:Family of unknown function (DUF6516)
MFPLGGGDGMTRGPDYELEALLSLDGQEFRFAKGYVMKFEARQVKPSQGRPHGVKYSLTLYDPEGRRIYGIDNAHRTGARREFDHRHPHGARKVVRYAWRGPVVLLDDFFREVERILHERGVS